MDLKHDHPSFTQNPSKAKGGDGGDHSLAGSGQKSEASVDPVVNIVIITLLISIIIINCSSY